MHAEQRCARLDLMGWATSDGVAHVLSCGYRGPYPYSDGAKKYQQLFQALLPKMDLKFPHLVIVLRNTNNVLTLIGCGLETGIQDISTMRVRRGREADWEFEEGRWGLGEG